MSMYPQALGTIPAETVRVRPCSLSQGDLGHAAALGELYQDEHFAALYPVEGQPASAPWRLALVTVLHSVENLTDPGCDFSLLSAFRTRLVNEHAEDLLLDRLLEICKQQGWLKAGGKQRSDSTHVLARVRSLSHLECVGETVRAVLDDLARLAPDWFERSSHRVEKYRLPKAESQRTALAQQNCTQSQTTGRVLHLRLQAAHEALQARRQEQQTPEFRRRSATHAGIEGTLSQGVRSMGLRRARSDGLYKTHVQHVLTAVAINLVRIDAVLTKTPRGKTRRSHFASLASHPCWQRDLCA